MLSNAIEGRGTLKWIGISLVSLAGIALLITSINKAKVAGSSGLVPPSPSDLNISSWRETTGSLRAGPPSYGMRKICFVRDHYVCVFDPRTGDTKRIVAGEDCAISPSGELIAFTVYVSLSHTIGWPKTIKILDLTTKTVNEIPSLPAALKMNPRWSPDGTRLAFEVTIENQLHVEVLNVASGEWSDVTRNLDFLEPWGETNRFGVNLDSWLPDGKSILCHDLNYIYEIGLDGSTLHRLSISSIVDPHEATISSATRFSFSRDRRLLLFDGNSEVKTGKLNLTLYIFDLEQHKLFRVMPETFNASAPEWLPSGRDILFRRLDENNDEGAIFDVCVTSVEGGEVTTLIKNGSGVSYSER